jgi:hypothetical protein
MEQVWFKGSSLRIKRKDRMKKKASHCGKGPLWARRGARTGLKVSSTRAGTCNGKALLHYCYVRVGTDAAPIEDCEECLWNRLNGAGTRVVSSRSYWHTGGFTTGVSASECIRNVHSLLESRHLRNALRQKGNAVSGPPSVCPSSQVVHKEEGHTSPIS